MTTECMKTACPYCGVGCGVKVDKGKIVGDDAHPANKGALCVKGSALAESLNMPSRLLYPKFNGKEISWDEATDVIAEAMNNSIQTKGPDSVAMYVSGQLLTEDYYVANKLMKGFVGSANIDTNSRLCMSSAVVAHNRAFGEDVVPVNYSDLDKAELIVICGANTAWTHPVIYRRIQQAREKNPKLKLVVIDPRKTVTAQQADLHLSIPNDADIALFDGLIRHCIDTGCLDTEFIERNTSGFDQLAEKLKSSKFTLAQLSDTLGIDKQSLLTFYRWFSETQKVVTVFCQGVNQSQTGSDKGNAIINAHLATGSIGMEGAGPFSITGQPNAMGGREVGGLANQLAIHRGFDQESIDAIKAFWRSSDIATKPGLKAVEMFEAVERGDIKVIWIMATNPVVSMPDNGYVRRALERCPMVIVSDITPDSDVAKYANLLLPAAGWGEKQGMVTNSERRMTRQRRFIQPPGCAKPDWQAICEVGQKLCERMEIANGFGFSNEVDIFREFAAMTGLNQDSSLMLDLSEHADISEQEYDNWKPQQWGKGQPFSDGKFSFPDGKAKFVVSDQLPEAQDPHWWLNTGRQRDQWHTMTRTGHIAHLAASELEPRVYMSQLSADLLGVKKGELVRVVNGDNSILAKATIEDTLPIKQLYMSMHWAGDYAGNSQVNAVVSRLVDPHSGQPAFKSSRVEVLPEKIASYGLYIGAQFSKESFAYCAFQAEKQSGIWRFANTKRVSKSYGQKSNQQRIMLDLPVGWLAFDYEETSSCRIVTSILVVSPKPVEIDYTKLIDLIGKPLSFAELITVASSEKSSQLVCSCFRVSDKQITSALESGRCHNVSQLQNQLKCGTNCGSCIPQVEALVNEHSAKTAVMK
ncbi:nitrate reductase [Vibrio coralliilyticus]|uniref:nitrate reductase n=1 Tax=Vibrio coralliilyticus TaxID=190893 RepID=UPI000512801B|nr:nitrate reductase [Vibrio coralliilyticus]AIS57045.1 nitrite reductase [Vibrio coralliilyticus]